LWEEVADMSRKKNPKIKVINQIKKGDILEIQVQHRYPSITGLATIGDSDDFMRKEAAVYLKEMKATYNGKEVGTFLMSSAVSANPRISFPLKVDEPGMLKVSFESNTGEKFEAEKEIKF